MRPRWIALFSLILGVAQPALVSAQEAHAGGGVEWSSEVRFLGANALISGATAGFIALLRGEPTGRAGKAFVRGAAGGAVVHAGKRIAVERWFGAGLIGRQVALSGSSMIRNAALGRGTFDQTAFGFGPIRGYVGGEGAGVEWAVDVPGVAAAAWGVMRSSHEFDLVESVSSGALVFTGGAHALPGTIFYTRDDRRAYVLAHERVHVLQYDQSFLLWGDPLESWFGQRFPALEAPLRHLEFNLVSLGAAVLLSVYAWPVHDDQPWEQEAIYLGGSR